MQFARSSVQFSGCWYIHKYVQLSLQSILEHFHHFKKTPKPFSYSLPLPLISTPSPKNPLIYFLSIDFPIVDFHMNRSLITFVK